MNYANEEMLNVIYDKKAKAYKLGHKRTNKIVRVIKQYKFITLLIITGITFSTINFILIKSFFRLLGRL